MRVDASLEEDRLLLGPKRWLGLSLGFRVQGLGLSFFPTKGGKPHVPVYDEDVLGPWELGICCLFEKALALAVAVATFFLGSGPY